MSAVWDLRLPKAPKSCVKSSDPIARTPEADGIVVHFRRRQIILSFMHVLQDGFPQLSVVAPNSLFVRIDGYILDSFVLCIQLCT